MGFSVLGLIVSNVLPSTPLVNSPLMKLIGSVSFVPRLEVGLVVVLTDQWAARTCRRLAV